MPGTHRGLDVVKVDRACKLGAMNVAKGGQTKLRANITRGVAILVI